VIFVLVIFDFYCTTKKDYMYIYDMFVARSRGRAHRHARGGGGGQVGHAPP